MSTIQDVKAAEQKLNAAKTALQGYVDRPASQAADHKLHRRLAEELKQATDEYVKQVIALG
jgi:hypothetical protein